MDILTWSLVVWSVVRMTSGAYSRDYCRKVQFDFNNAQGAVADFKACSDLEPRKFPAELTEKFTISWAKYVMERGLGEGLRALNNRDIRSILVPNDLWHEVVARTKGQLVNSPAETMSKIQTLVIFILVLQIMVIAYLVRSASDVADSLAMNMNL